MEAKRKLERVDSVILALYNSTEMKTTSVKVPQKLMKKCKEKGYNISMLTRIAMLVAVQKPEKLAKLAEEALRDAITVKV